jgi:ribosomal-protein-alanine N-acetyltransferase
MKNNLLSKRLQLLPVLPQDHHWFLKLNQHPVVRKYLWDDELISSELVAKIIQKNQTAFDEEKCGLWKLRLLKSQEDVGYAGLWYFFDEPQPQLMYVLHPEFHGQGLASEASALIVGHAFSKLGFNYLWAAMEEEHQASIKVAKNIGMTLLKTEVHNERLTRFYQIVKP